MADVQRAKETATADACRVTLAIFFTALLDKEGMEAEQLQRMDGYYLVEVDGNPHRFTLWETAMQFIHDQTAEERKKKT